MENDPDFTSVDESTHGWLFAEAFGGPSPPAPCTDCGEHTVSYVFADAGRKTTLITSVEAGDAAIDRAESTDTPLALGVICSQCRDDREFPLTGNARDDLVDGLHVLEEL